MSAGSCEETVSAVLDTLFDGAVLLAGDPVRAEALVVDATSGACDEYARAHDSRDFSTWIITRMIHRWFDAHGVNSLPAPADDGYGRGAPSLTNIITDLGRLEEQSTGVLEVLVRRAMSELPLGQRAALWLVNVVGFSYADAARAVRSERARLVETLYAARRSLQYLLAAALRSGAQADAGAA